MKKTTRALILLIPILLALTLPAKASAAERYSYQSSGHFAIAEWSSFDGCVETYAFLYAAESRVRFGSGPGSITEYGAVDVGIGKYDYCTGQELLAVYGSVPVGNSLSFTAMQSARLTATVPAYDYVTGNIVQIGIDLGWTGEGEMVRSTYRSRYNTGSFHFQSSSSGTFRYATLTGGLSIDGVSQALGTPSYSSLSNSRSTSMSIAR